MTVTEITATDPYYKSKAWRRLRAARLRLGNYAAGSRCYRDCGTSAASKRALPQSCRTTECGMRCCAEARGWGRLNPSGPWVPEPLRAFAPKNVQLNTKSPPGTGSRSWSGTGEAPTTCVVRSGERDKRLLRGGGVKSLSPLDATTAQGSFTDFFSDTGSFDLIKLIGQGIKPEATRPDFRMVERPHPTAALIIFPANQTPRFW